MCLEKKLKAYIESQFIAPDQNVYHYTNEQNYNEICRSKYLKLSSHTFLNIKDVTNQELKQAATLIINGLKQNNLGSYVEIFEKFLSKGIIFYTASFSMNKSIITSKKYGDFCLEFNTNLFKKFEQNNQLTLYSSVEYDLEKQKQIIKNIFNIYKISKKDGEDKYTLFRWLITILPLFKQPNDKNYNECRVIQIEGFDEKDGKMITDFISKKIPFCSKHDIVSIFRYN